MDNPETLATLGPQDTERRQTKGQTIMHNPETLATPQDTERRQTKGATLALGPQDTEDKPKGQSIQSGDTGNIRRHWDNGDTGNIRTTRH